MHYKIRKSIPIDILGCRLIFGPPVCLYCQCPSIGSQFPILDNGRECLIDPAFSTPNLEGFVGTRKVFGNFSMEWGVIGATTGYSVLCTGLCTLCVVSGNVIIYSRTDHQVISPCQFNFTIYNTRIISPCNDVTHDVVTFCDNKNIHSCVPVGVLKSKILKHRYNASF